MKDKEELINDSHSVIKNAIKDIHENFDKINGFIWMLGRNTHQSLSVIEYEMKQIEIKMKEMKSEK